MKIRRWIAVILSAVMLFTSVDLSSFAAEQEVTYDEAAVLDQMADSWLETCSDTSLVCMSGLVSYPLDGYMCLPMEEIRSKILNEVLTGYSDTTFVYFDLSEDELYDVLIESAEEAYKGEKYELEKMLELESEYLPWEIAAQEAKVQRTVLNGKLADGAELIDAIKDNYGFAIGFNACISAMSFFKEAKAATDINVKREKMLYGALLGNVGCQMSIEDCDVLVKNPDDSEQDKLAKLAETGVDLVSVFAPEVGILVSGVDLTMELAVNLLSISKKIDPISEYINLPSTIDEDMCAFFDAVSNQYGKYTYDIVDYEIVMDEYKGYLLDGEPYKIVDVPEELYSFPVTRFDGTFAEELDITEITIPSTITSRADTCIINNCDKLETVYYNALDCKGSYLGSFFFQCDNDFEVIFGEGIKTIPERFIIECGISEMNFPEGVTTINDATLLNCSNLTSVTIPSTVTEFGIYSLTSDGIISGCENLESVFYNPVNAKGHYYAAIFNDCGNNTEEMLFIIGEDVEVIPTTFINNCGMKTIEFPEGITLINEYAITDSNRLESITIPSTLIQFNDNYVTDYIFKGCNGLKTVYYNAPKAKNNLVPIFYNINSDFEIVFGKGIKEIPENFIRNCGLTSITFPEGVEKINHSCLVDCDSLKYVTVPTTVTSFGYDFVTECDTIDTIYYNAISVESPTSALISNSGNAENVNMKVILGDSVQTLPRYFIENCSITELIYPEGVTTIEADSLVDCHSLKTIVIPSTVTTIDNSVKNCENLTDIYYNAISAERIGTYGYVFDTCGTNGMEIHFADNIKSIPNKFMYDCGVSSVVFPEGITTMGSLILNSCARLEEVTLPSTLTVESGELISSCNNLKVLNYNPKRIQSEGPIYNTGIVYDCTSDFEVNFGKTVEELPNHFIKYAGITSVILPEHINAIGTQAFYQCDNLETIYFENRECEIYDSSYTIPQSTVIYGYYDSTAYQYAVKYDREFELIKETYTGTLGVNNNFYYKYDPTTQTLEIIGADEFGLYTDESGLTYVNMPDYTVKKVVFRDCNFTGSLYGLLVDYRNTIEEVVFEKCDTKKVTNIANMFAGCSKLKSVNLDEFNTANVTNMSGLFANCHSMKEINLSNFKIYTGCDTTNMFLNASGIDTIHTPYTMDEGIEIILPYDFRDEDSNIISSITTANRRQTINSALIIVGDVNGDGRVNVRDVIAVRKYIVDNNTEINLIAADADGNGRINVRDVIAIRKIIVGQ